MEHVQASETSLPVSWRGIQNGSQVVDRCDLGRILIIHVQFEADWTMYRRVIEHFLFHGEGFKMATKWPIDVIWVRL